MNVIANVVEYVVDMCPVSVPAVCALRAGPLPELHGERAQPSLQSDLSAGVPENLG